MKKLLMSMPPNVDHAYEMARQWYEGNPAARKLRVGHWDRLARAIAGAESLKALETAAREHLEGAGFDGKQNRWRNPDLTNGFLAEMKRVSLATESAELSDVVQRGFAPLDVNQQKEIVGEWKLELARRFLLAVVRCRKAESGLAEERT
ncbi:MAG: hypothetical protein K2X03_01490 [Bryobacteraceae bacterium]|nr:hypothetical protein [Bryobacteraceae bacterium]